MIIGTETEKVEFKLTTAEKNEAVESICAILNKHCAGTLYFGVDDNGFVVGQQVSDSTKKDVSRIIAQLLEPKITPSIDVITLDGKDIIRVSFSGHNRPYSIKGTFLTRIGTENRKMIGDELKRLIKNDSYSSKWEEELSDRTVDDLDEEALMDFYKSATNCGRLEMPKFDKERLITTLDLCKDGKLKNAAVVLFGKDAKVGLKLATYATDDKVTFTDLKLVNGHIYSLVNVAMSYILERINWRAEIGAVKRSEVPEIPERALREIVVNAFAHADYETLPEIEVSIHPGKLEIYNPGSFPDELTPFDFINKNMPSYKRNKLILDVLFRSKEVEKSGTGFQRVNDLCNRQNVDWGFRKEAYGFFFEFNRTNVLLNVLLNCELTEQEQIVFNLIANNKDMLQSDIAKRIGKSVKTVQRITQSLTQKGVIKREGSKKTGYWEIIGTGN